jgi:hypothetical protein
MPGVWIAAGFLKKMFGIASLKIVSFIFFVPEPVNKTHMKGTKRFVYFADGVCMANKVKSGFVHRLIALCSHSE